MIHTSTNEIPLGVARHLADKAPTTEPLPPQNTPPLTADIRNDHSTYLDYAYEEYCRVRDGGGSIDPEQFAARFPEIEESLLELIEVHSFVVGHSLLTAVEPEIQWPNAGEVFLGFELLEEIGKGAFSRVFLAREMGLGNRQVVVKVSQKGATEATMLGLLDHPHIIPVHSITANQAINLSALCMPYLGRTTAAEWIETRFKAASARRVKSQRHLQSVIEIGKGVCQGLQFAHSRQVLHCDIKPSNILITHDGEPLLLDFNLSTNPSQDMHLLGGTLMYMAPEQLLRAGGDRSAAITESTDVFCLGATLYHMASGQLPFPLSTSPPHPRLKDVMDVALETRRAFLGRSHALPEPLLSTLRHALAFDPNDRIRSASEFYERLLTCQKQMSRTRFRSIWLLAIPGALALGLASAIVLDHNKTPVESSERQTPSPDDDGILLESEEVKAARKAETESRYADAIELYRRILDADEFPNLTREQSASLRHALAFCLMMNGQYIEANMTFIELEAVGYRHEAFKRNQTTCLVLLTLSPQGLRDIETIKSTKLALKNLTETQGKNAEHEHALAIFDALLVNLEEAKNRESARTTSLIHLRLALALGLSKSKALAAGQLLPGWDYTDTFREIQKVGPELVPDRTVELPVQSPLSQSRTMAKVNLP